MGTRKKAKYSDEIKAAVIILAAIAFVFSLNIKQAKSGVKGGLHDLSVGGDSVFKYQTDQICVFCHTPHGANKAQSYQLDPGVDGLNNGSSAGALNGRYLWNRRTPERTFDLYTSSTLTNVASPSMASPNILSILCLSCHDGIGAMNVLLNNPNGEYTTLTGQGYVEHVSPGSINQFGDAALTDPSIGPLNIGDGVADGGDGTAGTSGGTNLTNDHPIGFLYNSAAVQDTGLLPYASVAVAIKDRMDGITDGRVECSTCHDPHMNNTSSTRNSFLVMGNENSALCLGCHDK